MAARLERDLGVKVERIDGKSGEFKVLVDGSVVIDGGAWAALAFPSRARSAVRAVREALGR